MRKCLVDGCENKYHAKGYCKRHSRHMLKYGKIIPETNEIIKYFNYAEIILLNIRLEEVGRALIDLDDIDKIINYKWYLGSHGYACNDKIGLLHRFILNAQKGEEIDHRSINPLDNRKSNLRKCTSSQNSMNRKKQSNNTSGVTGVSWNKNENKWHSRIKVNYKNIHLGYFVNLDEAIKARKNAEIKYFGEFTPQIKGGS